ncbi:ABC transporter permease [Rhizobium sp. CF142]|uniref:ABC transporter permease n=1 Tax=Rhizobium sp. CF142 TaxID=1144314 RepID=UPI00026EF6BE|nr:ABC transporter permease subunit [Rhizobium sp. CF142]EJJ26959.1 ABC-type spermidine/putrescine transport system, permease component II [Rhizobium sp. CF142]
MSRFVLKFVRQFFLLCLAFFLAAPLIIVAGVSFNTTAQMTFPPQNISLRWYWTFMEDPAWTSAFLRSVIIAIASSLLTITVAFPIAYIQWKTDSRFAKLLAGMAGVPFILPPVVIAVLFLLFWGTVRHVGQIENIVISHAVTFIAVPLVMISLGFSGIDKSLVEAARTMGARENDILRTVAIPMVLPFVVSSFIFVAIFSLNEYVIAFMVAGFTAETMPVKIFSNMRTGFSPTMCVGAVLFMLIGLFGFITVARLGNLPKLLGARF